MKRRDFLVNTSILGVGLTQSKKCIAEGTSFGGTDPIVLSTWDFGVKANEVAWKILSEGGRALDAVEQGVRLIEADPTIQTVGYGGFPDREGYVTLDACIMDEHSGCGSVAFLRDIKHPISVARKVMEETPHIMLVGDGAQQFALSQGFKKENLLTEESQKAWEEWKKEENYQPVINIENHDTISMLALDAKGNISGACTTSGAAWKMYGRVGDSPLIGSGLFLDNEVGGACATGLGEAVIRTAGSAMVVEAMRHGATPQDACKLIVDRIRSKHTNIKDLQVGFLAMNKSGEYGAYAVHQGFTFGVRNQAGSELIDAQSIF